MTDTAFRDDIRRGELYWLDWTPGRGSEQTGMRPALIIQANAGNSNPRYNLTIVAAVSTKGKSHIPTHVEIQPSSENGFQQVSYIKAEQVMTVDKNRLRTRIGSISSEEMSQVEAALKKAQGMG